MVSQERSKGEFTLIDCILCTFLALFDLSNIILFKDITDIERLFWHEIILNFVYSTVKLPWCRPPSPLCTSGKFSFLPPAVIVCYRSVYFPKTFSTRSYIWFRRKSTQKKWTHFVSHFLNKIHLLINLWKIYTLVAPKFLIFIYISFAFSPKLSNYFFKWM